MKVYLLLLLFLSRNISSSLEESVSVRFYWHYHKFLIMIDFSYSRTVEKFQEVKNHF